MYNVQWRLFPPWKNLSPWKVEEEGFHKELSRTSGVTLRTMRSWPQSLAPITPVMHTALYAPVFSRPVQLCHPEAVLLSSAAEWECLPPIWKPHPTRAARQSWPRCFDLLLVVCINAWEHLCPGGPCWAKEFQPYLLEVRSQNVGRGWGECTPHTYSRLLQRTPGASFIHLFNQHF